MEHAAPHSIHAPSTQPEALRAHAQFKKAKASRTGGRFLRPTRKNSKGSPKKMGADRKLFGSVFSAQNLLFFQALLEPC